MIMTKSDVQALLNLDTLNYIFTLFVCVANTNTNTNTNVSPIQLYMFIWSVSLMVISVKHFLIQNNELLVMTLLIGQGSAHASWPTGPWVLVPLRGSSSDLLGYPCQVKGCDKEINRTLNCQVLLVWIRLQSC